MDIAHLEVLDKKRQDLLPLFKPFKNTFYLAGGTALALILGHRDSIDFDFFSEQSFDTDKLFIQLQSVFQEFEIQKIQEETNTLTIILDQEIKISFFSYPYKLLEDAMDTENIRFASVIDIACMKLSAIVSRSTIKDYVDLYYILKQTSLSTLLDSCSSKFPQLDKMLILKSLVYFDDMDNTPLKFMPEKEVDLEKIKKYFQEITEEYFNNSK